MTPIAQRVEAALKAVGATLQRGSTHNVYVLPNGNKVTLSRTPSDYRAQFNQVRDIYRAAGVSKPARRKHQGSKRQKHGRPDQAWAGLPVMGSALAAAGVVDLEKRVRELETQRDIASERASRWQAAHTEAVAETAALAEARARLEDTWWMRLGRWIKAVRA